MRRLLLACACAGALASSAHAATTAPNPVVLSQQGRLTDASDQLVSGEATLDFKLFPTATGGTASWSDSFSLNVENGLYAVELGGTDGHPTLDASDFAGTVYLGIFVNGQEMSPRMLVGALPTAAFARQAGDASTLGGHPASDFLLLGSGGSLGDDVSAGTITATDGFAGDLHGNADTATVAAEASAPAESFTLDGSKLTGHVDTSLLSGDLPAASVVGALTRATIDGQKITGRVDTSLLAGNVPAASVSGALTNATIDGSNITGHVDTSLLSGDVAASNVSGALSNATIAGGSVSGRVGDSSALGGRPATDFASAFAQNLQPGGTFEEGGLYYWSIAAGSASNSTLPTIDGAGAHSGTHAIKFFSGGTGSSLEGTLLPVRAGSRLRVSAWAKGNVTKGSQAFDDLYLAGRWYRSDGTLAGTPANGCGGGCPDLDLIGTESVANWRYAEHVYPVPDDAAYYRITLLGLNGDATGTAWVDDVRVETDGGGDVAVEPAPSGFKAAGGFRDWRDNSGTCAANAWCPVPDRTLTYVKRRPDSVLRVSYQDTLGTDGTSYDQCDWAITVTPGGAPSAPGGATQVLVFSAGDRSRDTNTTNWTMDNATHTALDTSAPVGPLTIQVYNLRRSAGQECLSGWNQAGGFVSAEELVSEP